MDHFSIKKSNWELFGVDETATLNELKKSYFQIAVLVHPDKNPSSSNEEMMNLIEIYNALKLFIEKRDEYENVSNSKDLNQYRIDQLEKMDMKLGKSEIPSIMEIFEEVYDVNKNWKKNIESQGNDVVRPFSEFGYELCESEYRGLSTFPKYSPNIKEMKLNDLEDLENKDDSMTIYENLEKSDSTHHINAISVYNPHSFSDYKEVFSELSIEHNYEYFNVEDRFFLYKNERNYTIEKKLK